MKHTVLVIGSGLILIAGLLTACSAPATQAPTPTPTAAPSEAVHDYASLEAALKAKGVTVEAGGEIEQAFFTVKGQVIKVNGADVQVFEYAEAATAEIEAALVAPDGGSIGTTMVTWVEAPHFYKAGNLIVLYVGTDTQVTGALESVLGPQFAGR